MDAIRTENLSKVYPGLRTSATALAGLNLEVTPGEIFGYLGPNGAGKTTTLKILMGLVRPTSGSAWLLGRPVAEPWTRRDAGFMPERPEFPAHLNCRELLEMCGRLSGLSKPEAERRTGILLHRTELEGAAKKRIRWLSKGMLQWLGLAQALVCEPQILILDEPMSGLDPIGRRRMRDLILEEQARGTTVFFSSHILADVEMICDRVGILDRGRLLQCGRLSEILERGSSGAEIRVKDLPRAAADPLLALGARVRRFGDETLIEAEGGDQVHLILERIWQAGARLQSLVPHRESLEDYFLRQMERTRGRSRDLGAAAREKRTGHGGRGPAVREMQRGKMPGAPVGSSRE